MYPSFRLRTRALQALLGVSLPLFVTALSQAQTLPNPSFETENYSAWPGYWNGNVPITGWTTTTPANVGQNPASGSPFADNGAVPAGANVAFLQSTAGGSNLSTTISGLTAGTNYRLAFRANARGGQNPTLKVTVDGTAMALSTDFDLPQASANLTSVNGSNPYHYVTGSFIATGATAALTLVNDAAGDNTAAVDDFVVTLATVPPTPVVVATRWTGDADSGINSAFRYTHARTMGNTQREAVVNGVNFIRATGPNPNHPGHMSWTGFANIFGDQTRAISGGSNTLAQSFMFGGPNTGVTIQGLKANTTYVATIYGVGWENGTRSADFSGSAGGGPTNVNLDAFGVTQGITVRYLYTTDASGTAVTLSYPQAGGAGSFHTSAFSNREALPAATPNPWTANAWTNNATSGINDGAVYAYTHAYNFGSSAGATVNGVNFTGLAGGNPTAANLSLAGFNGVFGNDGNNVADAGGSRALANDFIYNGFPGSITLSGLTPGKQYNLSLFSVGWEGVGGRVINFQGYEQTGATLDQDAYDNNNGIRFGYTYTAPASGTMTVTTTPIGAGSFHIYALANRETTPQTVLAVTAQPLDVYVTVGGGSATFTASASGNAPLTYEWRKNGIAIPGQNGTTPLTATLNLTGISAADAGNYTVAFTGSGGQGTVVSNVAKLVYATDVVPGLFDTGVGSNCKVLPDGQADPHYLLLINPDGPGLTPPVVHNAQVFPIVAGPWVANNAQSKWISPRFDSSGAAGLASDGGAGAGTYVYRVTLDLTGFDPATVRVFGSWATDNTGTGIRVNDVSTGLTNPGQFPSLTDFVISNSSLFTAGINSIDFLVKNEDAVAGFTGLQVRNLRAFGVIAPNTAPYIAVQPVDTTIPWGGSDTLCISASGSANLTYQWLKNGTALSGETSPSITIAADAVSKAGVYTCRVSNGAGMVDSTTATVVFTGVPPIPGSYSLGATPNVAAKVAATTLVALAQGGSGPLTLSGVQSGATAGGGSVVISEGYAIYQPASGFTGADSFTYTLTDGTQSGTGTVNVVVAQGIGQTVNLVGITTEGAGKRVAALGIPGRTYQVQHSSDLSTWTTFATESCPASGVISVADPGPLPPSRFYRMVQP
jgi:hypothetical protein